MSETYFSGRKIRKENDSNVETNELSAERNSELTLNKQNELTKVVDRRKRSRIRAKILLRKKETTIEANSNLSQALKISEIVTQNLLGESITPLIGVFGMNSDNVIREALNNLNEESLRDSGVKFYALDIQTHSATANDIYVSFAACIKCFIEREDVKDKIPIPQYRDILVSLNEVVHATVDCKDEDNHFARMHANLNRATLCKDILNKLTSALGSEACQFIINFEVPMFGLDSKVLAQAHSLASERLIIILNNLLSLDAEKVFLEEKYMIHEAYQLLNKYIYFENIIDVK